MTQQSNELIRHAITEQMPVDLLMHLIDTVVSYEIALATSTLTLTPQTPYTPYTPYYGQKPLQFNANKHDFSTTGVDATQQVTVNDSTGISMNKQEARQASHDVTPIKG